MEVFYLDSYAIIEIVKGNKNYEKYKGAKFITSKVNLFEVHYKLLREDGLELANSVVRSCQKFVIDFDVKDIIEGSKFKLREKERKLAMADCLGYVIARNNDARFLTGDKEFKDLENVEFVK
jgi:PIN domain nuclease of toxin-antitoxin system